MLRNNSQRQFRTSNSQPVRIISLIPAVALRVTALRHLLNGGLGVRADDANKSAWFASQCGTSNSMAWVANQPLSAQIVSFFFQRYHYRYYNLNSQSFINRGFEWFFLLHAFQVCIGQRRICLTDLSFWHAAEESKIRRNSACLSVIFSLEYWAIASAA